jgi:hypothetical protein
MHSEYEKLENHTKYHNASDFIMVSWDVLITDMRIKAASLGRPYVPSLLFYTPWPKYPQNCSCKRSKIFVACSSTTCRRTNKRFDRTCQERGIRRKTLSHSRGAPISRYHEYGWFNNTAFFVPSSYRLSLLQLYHDENYHVGAQKALELLSRHF